MMRFYSLLFLVLLLSCEPEPANLTFQVQSKVPLLPSEKIYITGNHVNLGNWHPHSTTTALQKEEDFWRATFQFPKETSLEFKFTKGSWNNEAVSSKGRVLRNFKHWVSKDTTFKISIENWRDHLFNSTPEISGNYIIHKDFPVEHLPSRTVIVWLPPSYIQDSLRHYPVLYTHDGQNVFDPHTSTLGYDWRIDEIADSLIQADVIEEFICVATYCNPDNRSPEYSNQPEGDLYQAFMCKQLKPFIDSTYRTLTDAQNTATLGASMGGLVSFILAWEHPEVFGKAACLSPAFQFDWQGIDYIKPVKMDTHAPRNIQLYIDNGTKDLEVELQPGIDKMMEILMEKGYDFEWFLDKGATHNEKAWSGRVWRPLVLFYGK